MNFRPLHDRVVIRRIEEDEKTAGGIIIPDTAKEKPSQGEVVAVGPGARNEKGETIAPDVKVGDVVRSEEHTSELQSLMRISYAVFCLKKKKHTKQKTHTNTKNDRSTT